MDLLPANHDTIEYLRREAPRELERLRSIDRLGADRRRYRPGILEGWFPTDRIRQPMKLVGTGLVAAAAVTTFGLVAARALRGDRGDRLGASDCSPFEDELDLSSRGSDRHPEPFHECFA